LLFQVASNVSNCLLGNALSPACTQRGGGLAQAGGATALPFNRNTYPLACAKPLVVRSAFFVNMLVLLLILLIHF